MMTSKDATSLLKQPEAVEPRPSEIEFATDLNGRIVWAGGSFGPSLVGIRLGQDDPAAPARSSARTAAAFAAEAPIVAGWARIEGAPPVAGLWRVDAEPRFGPITNVFAGYRGTLTRLAPAHEGADMVPDQALDRDPLEMRVMLHELRTPLNAIQGFAELVLMQRPDPIPSEVRTLAIDIIADAARILANFDDYAELLRLASGDAPASLANRAPGALSSGTAGL